ncbi:hypothetical protein [Streptomyces sp. NBC_00209]|uniref:hypothetical protein n=1 Tax=Streptomyces sp. NBC_00209 TaxID=2975682 RepID=UPI00324BD940
MLVAPDPVEAAEEVHRRLDALDPPVRHRTLRLLVAGMPVENEERARALARVLVRTGTGYLAVCTGLALLTELGESQDVPYLRTLGRLRTLAYPVIHALDVLDRPAGALLELRNHREPVTFGPLLAALDAGDRTAVRGRLAALEGDLAPDVARRVAEAFRLADLLTAVPGLPIREGAALVARTGRLLFLMTTLRDYRPEILSYLDAPRAYAAFARGAGLLPATLDHHALLLSAVQELSTGPTVLHAWGPGRREAALSQLMAVLRRPEWWVVPDGEGDESGVRWRVAWVRRTRAQVLGAPQAPGARLRIAIHERDPEIRPPSRRVFLSTGVRSSRTTSAGGPPTPRRSCCSPAPCGPRTNRARCGLPRRTARRAVAGRCMSPCGGTGIRSSGPAGEAPFRRVADVNCPNSASTHPRTTPRSPVRRATRAGCGRAARLVAAGLRGRPDLLARWSVRFDWAGTAFRDPDETLVSLLHDVEDGHVRQILWHIPEDGTPPEDRAAAALRRLSEEDPRAYGR